ncbi:DNA-binding IclR family transcriptional regulator [Labrys monachus]|uniref:DNA-binding IclR family transcriptional regulator n=1 Tax=Labrys monachus TaxID=217067 RepID=A0ABU0FAV7_9HYPH|nr:DNA-binding IclR family transcriptional regulator [Labrys monachus]
MTEVTRKRALRQSSAPANKAPAVAKAIAILDDLAQLSGAASVSAIARRTEFSKSSVSDICSTLSGLGLLWRDREGHYLLGHRIVELARALVGGHRLIEVFAEACESVPEVRDETVTLSILDGVDVVIVATRHGRAALPITARIGLRLPVWSTASGRCFLQSHTPARLEEILAVASAAPTSVSGRVPSIRQLASELALEHVKGFHVDEGSTAAGLTCFGAPVEADAPGRTIAAVAIAVRSDALSATRRADLGRAAVAVAVACKTLAGPDLVDLAAAR